MSPFGLGEDLADCEAELAALKADAAALPVPALDALRQNVIDAALDVDALWEAQEGEPIRWQVEAAEALEDLRSAVAALGSQEDVK